MTKEYQKKSGKMNIFKEKYRMAFEKKVKKSLIPGIYSISEFENLDRRFPLSISKHFHF